jgi:hypothetical protein
MERLGVNAVRLFATTAGSLRRFVPTTHWGKSLNGTRVRSAGDFNRTVDQMRTPEGHDKLNPMKFPNPMDWNGLEVDLAKVSSVNTLSGSTTNSLDKHRTMGLNTLLVLQVSRGGPGTTFIFNSTNNASEEYLLGREVGVVQVQLRNILVVIT